MIVYFIGPDGAGKTTLANNVASTILKHGIKVKVSWGMRGPYKPLVLLAKILSKFDVFKGFEDPIHNISIPKVFRRLWQFLESFCIIFTYFYRYHIPHLLGYIVIGDRSPLDSIIWIILITHDPRYLRSITAKFFLALTYRANIKIYLIADPSKLLERKKDMSRKFVEKEIELYSKIIYLINVQKMDTTNESIDNLVDRVLKLVSR